MLRQIKIDGYKSFHPLEVRLGQLAVLIGPNAAGKSNLLDAIYLISRLVTCPNLMEAFEGHRGLPLESMWYGDEGFQRLLQEDSVTCSFEVCVELSESVIEETERAILQKRAGLDSEEKQKKRVQERFLRYRVCVELVPKTGVLRVVDEELRALTNELAPKPDRNRKAFLEKEGDRLILRMEGQGHPTYFAIGLDHTIVSTRLYEPHYPHVTALRLELEKWHSYYLEPRALMRENVPVSEVRTMGPRGENFAAFLNTLRNRRPQSFDNFRRTVQSILPTRPGIDVELSKEGMVGLTVTEDGIVFSGRLISEGTLRVLGLIAAVHPENPSMLVGYEEPENGVHPARVRTIADILRNASDRYGKQIIVTTHSPLFAGCFGGEGLYICRKAGRRSAVEPLDTNGPLFAGKDIEAALEEAMVRGDFGG